jgi:hypothetical protein
MFVEHGRETLPGFLEGVDAIAAGPPLHAAAPHDKGSKQQLSGADFDSHGVAAVEFSQLDRVGQIGDYLSAGYAAFSSHAVNRITEGAGA